MTNVLFIKNSGAYEAHAFSDECGEITFYGSFRVGTKLYERVPYLRLFIDEYDAEDGEVFFVDEYFPLLPRLKPIGLFRSHFLQWMVPNALHSETFKRSPMLTAGLRAYAKKLETFSEDASVVRQAKTVVNQLRHERSRDVKRAYDVLGALERMPCTEHCFAVTE